MTIIKIDNFNYRIGRLNAIRQFHVARRLAPVLAIMGITAAQLTAGAKMNIDDFIPLLGPISDVVSKMKDEEANYIIFECLDVVEREVVMSNEVRYQRVSAGHNLIFEDLDMPAMLRLVVAVVQENLADFLKGLGAEAPSPSP